MNKWLSSLFSYHKLELFLLLVVLGSIGTVGFSLYRQGMGPKKEFIAGIRLDQQFSNRIEAARSYCMDRCTVANLNYCDSGYVAQYCLSQLKDSLDVDGKNDYKIVDGIGICEDRVYCSQLISCRCNTTLSTQGCVRQLCRYWKDQHVTNTTLALTRNILPGNCTFTTKDNHWYNMINLFCPS